MLRALLRFPIFSTLIALLTSFAFAGSQDAEQPREKSDGVPSADSPGAYFAGLMDACQQIDFLSRNERFEALLQASQRFRDYLKDASEYLPPSEPRRLAKFTAAKRSLEQLSLAIHNFLWRNDERSLRDASEKLQLLANHTQSLLSAEEIEQARQYKQLAKS